MSLDKKVVLRFMATPQKNNHIILSNFMANCSTMKIYLSLTGIKDQFLMVPEKR